MDDLWIPRDLITELSSALKQRPAILLTGMRQTGKSSLLQNLFPDFEYITFDKVQYAKEAEENPEGFLNSFKNPVILDEIQYVPSLFRELKIQIDSNRKRNGKWILTGSQTFSLMKGVSESLAGRIGIFTLYTLSSKEIRGNYKLSSRVNDLLWKGGFPEVWTKKGLSVKNFYEDYIQSYIERDLRRILDIGNLRDFQRFVKSCAIRCSQILNFSDLARDVGISGVTAKKWIHALEASGVIHLLQPYYTNLGKRLIKAPKLYFSDTGLLCSLLGVHSGADYKNYILDGQIWENYVFTELIKKRIFKNAYNLFYYRDQNGVEIDFLLETAKQVILVEAKKTERPSEDKLNFRKVAPLLVKFKPKCLLACPVPESRIINFKDYGLWNPLLVDSW